MQADTTCRLIAWNGIELHIPISWDARVSGKRQLVFERDFQPQLQLRWENADRLNSRKLNNAIQRFAEHLDFSILADVHPLDFSMLYKRFNLIRFFQSDKERITGGAFYSPESQSLVFFQLLGIQSSWQEADKCLASVQFPCTSMTLWCIQDFSLNIPSSFILKDYTFGAGLNRLSFYHAGLYLQTCTLGPADIRLDRQSPENMLRTLTDTRDLQIIVKDTDKSCEGQRHPGILGQIYRRLRREKPFLSARLWHDTKNNRLLAVVLSSNRPIPFTTTDNICNHYEIIQEKRK